jgi:hypothetical protein
LFLELPIDFTVAVSTSDSFVDNDECAFCAAEGEGNNEENDI